MRHKFTKRAVCKLVACMEDLSVEAFKRYESQLVWAVGLGLHLSMQFKPEATKLTP